jgi:ABC-type branched-subunit amino acid transport system ATPase component/ABC-type branched-subunit amino acid transport system permease subunit
MTSLLLRHSSKILLAAAVCASFLISSYQLSVATYVMIFSIVCIGLVVMTGIGGMMSFGQAAFVGLGAYITGYLSSTCELSPWIGLAAALTGAILVATLIGSVTVRMSGHYLALVTLCFCISFYFLAGNTDALGRFNGMTGIPPISLGGYELRSERSNYLIVLAALALVAWWTRRILASRVGRVLRSLRAGPVIAEIFGASAYHHRLLAFVIAAVFAAFSGWLYAHTQRFVNPTPFDVHMSIEYLFMTVIGGSGQVWGAILGAGLVTSVKQELQNLLRPIFGPTTRLEMLIFAGLMILILAKARRGLWPMIGAWTDRATLRPPAVESVILDSIRARPDAGLPLLTATRMRRTFGGLVAVDDVSFDVRAGEILGLLGPNGAGKTTLFNLISGALRPTSGSVGLLGVPVPNVVARDMCRRGIARTFQHVKLVPDMTLVENVAIGATQLGRRGLISTTLGLDRAEEQLILGWAMHLLGRVGLADKAWDLAGSLPLGHQRLLEIARALAADPVLLLLDEPAAGLRANEKAELARLLRSLCDGGLGILLVEHDMEFVSSVADRLMVMNFGRCIAIGDPTEVRSNTEVQEAYLGVAA